MALLLPAAAETKTATKKPTPPNNIMFKCNVGSWTFLVSAIFPLATTLSISILASTVGSLTAHTSASHFINCLRPQPEEV